MFIIVGLVVYLVVNVYLLQRAWKALAGLGGWRRVVLGAYLVFSSSIFLMHSFEHGEPGRLAEAVWVCASFYMGMLLYLPLFTIVADLVLFVDRRVPILPAPLRANRKKAGVVAFGLVLGSTVLLLLGGTIHARHVRVRPVEVRIDKPGGALASLNLVALADVHIGPLMRVSRFEDIIRRVNALEPDIVLLLGDLMNEEALRSERERLPAALAGLRARYGVFTCFGQHEYFIGRRTSLDIYKAGRVRVLEDEAVLVADSFYLAGRGGLGYFSSPKGRPSLEQLLHGADRAKPVLVMDHTPLGLDEAVAAGIDLQLGGHTHGGQVVPATWVANLLFKPGSGYARRGKTQFYVSPGVGVWSPPARIGTTAEITQLLITFQSPAGDTK